MKGIQLSRTILAYDHRAALNPQHIVMSDMQHDKEELDFLDDLPFPDMMQTAHEEFREMLRTPEKVKKNTRDNIPTSMPEFELSLQLQADLRHGCPAGSTRRQNASDLVERVCEEAADYAKKRKKEARVFLKNGHKDLQKKCSYFHSKQSKKPYRG